MTNKYGQTMEDFKGRLNMSIFSNVEKSHNVSEIQSQFGNDCIILEKSTVDSFIQDIYKGIGGNIVKGRFNDTPEAKEILEKAEGEIKSLTRVLFNDGSGVDREVFVMKAKAEEFQKSKGSDTVIGKNIEKAKEDQINRESIEKAGTDNDLVNKESKEELEKGKIMESFNYSSLLKFNKTGKEIKEKAIAEKARIEAKVLATETAINEFLAGCQGNLPTEKPYLYGMKQQIKCPYFKFHYYLTEYYDGRDLNASTSLSDGTQCYPSASHEEAKPFNDYNRLVEEWCDDKGELLLLDLFISNFEDSKKYELNAEQMVALGF